MHDTAPQTPAGKVLCHFSMSLDGFVAGRDHDMSWMPEATNRPGLRAAGGKNVEVLSPSIGRQLLERGLLDELDLHVLPVLLGDGVRLYDNPGGAPVPLELVNGEPLEEINVRYRPVGYLHPVPAASR